MSMRLYMGERGLLTPAGKEIKYRKEILTLLEAIWLLKGVAIGHCKGRPKGGSSEARSSREADVATQEVAPESLGPLHVLVALLEPNLLDLT